MGQEIGQAQEAKICNQCGELKETVTSYYKKPGTFDGYSQTCVECTRAGNRAKKKSTGQTADDIIHQIETGQFEVDQKWLLKELITQYKDPKCRDRLKALDMIMKVSGYKDTNSDDKAIMDSLLESLKNGSSDKNS